MSNLSPVSPKNRFVNDDGTLTSYALLLLQTLAVRVGGSLGDTGNNVFAPLVADGELSHLALVQVPDARLEWPLVAPPVAQEFGEAINQPATLDSVYTSSSGLLKATNGVISSAVAGTDYVAPEVGAWAVADTSGAALTLTVANAKYERLDKVIVCSADITYPVTASGSSASLSLPYSTMAGAIGNGFIGYSNFGSGLTVAFGGVGSVSSFGLFTVAGATVTNANLSGKRFILTNVYLAA